jgi:hypothetical protein
MTTKPKTPKKAETKESELEAIKRRLAALEQAVNGRVCE